MADRSSLHHSASTALYLMSVCLTNVTFLARNINTVIACVFKQLFYILKSVSNCPGRLITYRPQGDCMSSSPKCSLNLNPGFHSRRRHSFQDQVVLHEAQLWKQDTQLHEGGESRQSFARCQSGWQHCILLTSASALSAGRSHQKHPGRPSEKWVC